MAQVIRKLVVLGAGSAGFMASLGLKLTLPTLEVVVIRSPNVPVIGVGESTTVALPTFLHAALRLDQKQFFAEVRPSWKLGIHFLWGDPQVSHFNYTFDPCVDIHFSVWSKLNAYFALHGGSDSSVFYALMDQLKGPCFLSSGYYQVEERVGYHIENKAYIAYLEKKSRQFGVDIIDADVVSARRDESGDVTALVLEDGREVAGDFFIDCSGFRSFLLHQTLGEPYISFRKTLLCDRAVVGSWDRSDEPILPYTTAETMNNGWCWRIEFEDHINRGYVHSSAFCSVEEAMAEVKTKNPRLGELRTVTFPSGRYENFWSHNVAAVGNASGFVEPLEATALHVIVEQVCMLYRALSDGGMRVVPEIRALQNRRSGEIWDDIRNFLSVHYRFNRRLDTPFWRHCRAEVDLAGAAPLVDFYRRVGPSALCQHLVSPSSIFGMPGYLELLVGQRVPTDCLAQLSEEEWRQWEQFRQQVRQKAALALPVAEALQLVNSPGWRWPNQGI